MWWLTGYGPGREIRRSPDPCLTCCLKVTVSSFGNSIVQTILQFSFRSNTDPSTLNLQIYWGGSGWYPVVLDSPSRQRCGSLVPSPGGAAARRLWLWTASTRGSVWAGCRPRSVWYSAETGTAPRWPVAAACRNRKYSNAREKDKAESFNPRNMWLWHIKATTDGVCGSTVCGYTYCEYLSDIDKLPMLLQKDFAFLSIVTQPDVGL